MSNNHDDDCYDDGLVHGHGWATEKPMPVIVPSPRMGGSAPAPDDGYDDGLVHGHAWACAERGRPATPPILPAE